jgi:hypothetical protein
MRIPCEKILLKLKADDFEFTNFVFGIVAVPSGKRYGNVTYNSLTCKNMSES